MSLPFQIRQSVAKDVYGHQLASMVSSGRAHDQSVALARDPNVYEKLKLDATVSHLITIRKHMVAGSRWQMRPASTRDVDKKAAEVVERVVELGMKSFATARFNLADAVFTGSSFGRVLGELKWMNVFDGIPRQFWVPTSLVDVDRRRFDKVYETVGTGTQSEHVEVRWRMFDYLKNDWVPWLNPEWYVKNVYNDQEETLGYGSGLIDSMYFYWRAKEILWKAGLQGAERWAQGFIVIKVDNARSASTGKTNQAIVNSFLTELNKQRSQHHFVMDKIDEVEVLPGPGQGSEIVERMIQYCDRQLRLLVLGSNLPTEASGGGSYNLAEVQQGTTETLIKYDRDILAEALTNDLLTLTWNVNRSVLRDMGLASAEMPTFMILEDRKRDLATMATVTKTLLEAGFKLKADEAYELVERTMPGPGDEIIEQAAPAAPVGFGPGGDPGGDGKTERPEYPSDRERDQRRRNAAGGRGRMDGTAHSPPFRRMTSVDWTVQGE